MKVIHSEEKYPVVITGASPNWTGTMDELAKFIVPEGAKYKIVEDSFVTSDRSFRDAWEIDESELTDGVGE